MVDQTTMNGRNGGGAAESQQPMPSVGDVGSHATELAHDAITLIELQFKLLYVDIRDVTTRATGGVVLLAAMVALLLGCVPVLLLAAGEGLITAFQWSRPLSYAVVAGSTAVVGVVAGLVTVRRLQRVVSVLARSHSELLKNLEFLKSLAASPRRPRF
jgi:hypothetical protein